jgi:hypothetical protein
MQKIKTTFSKETKEFKIPKHWITCDVKDYGFKNKETKGSENKRCVNTNSV